YFLQQAVETMADEDALFGGLDVDVARAARDRAVHDEVDEIDDRRRVSALAVRDAWRCGVLEHVVVRAAHERARRRGAVGRAPRRTRPGRRPGGEPRGQAPA